MSFNIDSNNDQTNRKFSFHTNGVDAAGTELLTINEGGCVGINCATPPVELTVAGDICVGRILSTCTTGSTIYALEMSRSGSGGTATDIWGTNGLLSLGSSSTGKHLIIKSGDVGIGTDAPAQLLDVVGGHIRLDSGKSLQWGNGHERIEAYEDGCIKFLTNDGTNMILKGDCGGIGVDISCLRTKNAIVHNAADSSTGAVSFMELYSLDDIFKAEGEMKYKAGHGGIACKLQHFGGDGYFPVYAWKGYKNKYSPPNTAFQVMLYE